MSLPLLGTGKCSPNPAGPTYDLLTGLGAYYRFQNDLTDSSGNARHLTDIGGTTYQAAKINQGLASEGGSLVTAWPAGSLQNTSVSISGWFFAADGNNPSVNTKGAIGGWNHFSIRYHSQQDVDWRVGMVITGLVTAPNGDADVVPNQWNHVVATWDHTTTPSHTANLYINSTLTVTRTGTGSAAVFSLIFFDATDAISSGLDEVGLWSRVLSPGEILALYNFGNGFDPTV